MRVTVFGATGPLGRHVVEDLTFRGHDVVVHASAPAQMPACWRGRVDVVVGELTDPAVVDAAVGEGQAVVSVLGPGRDGVPARTSLGECTRLILECMERHGVRRYVGLGTCRRLAPQERLTAGERAQQLVSLGLHPRGHREMLDTVEEVTASGLEWTLVRYLATRGGAARGLKHVGQFGRDQVGPRVTRADVARFIAAQVLERSYIGAAPAVSN